MSDFNIYSVPSYQVHVVDMKFESVGTDSFVIIEEQSPSPSFPMNDGIVKVSVVNNGITKHIFGSFISQDYDGLDFRITIGFDSIVYGSLADAETDVIKLEYCEANDLELAMEVNSYNISPSIQSATYGKSFNQYHYTESYSLSVPQQRIAYNNEFRSLYVNYNDKVLIDSCENKVYKVSPTELSSVAVNGRIKTALNFNVVIK